MTEVLLDSQQLQSLESTLDQAQQLVSSLQTQNQLLRAWVLARCWGYTSWGDGDDEWNFRTCVECHGWDPDDYVRFAKAGRVPQGDGRYYGLDRRGHQSGCLVATLLVEPETKP